MTDNSAVAARTGYPGADSSAATAGLAPQRTNAAMAY